MLHAGFFLAFTNLMVMQGGSAQWGAANEIWDDSVSFIWLPKKVVAPLHPLNKKASSFECSNQGFHCNL
jgi:hypothetical protein